MDAHLTGILALLWGPQISEQVNEADVKLLFFFLLLFEETILPIVHIVHNTRWDYFMSELEGSIGCSLPLERRHLKPKLPL